LAPPIPAQPADFKLHRKSSRELAEPSARKSSLAKIPARAGAAPGAINDCGVRIACLALWRRPGPHMAPSRANLIAKFLHKCDSDISKPQAILHPFEGGKSFMMASHRQCRKDVMHRMNFSQAGVPQNDKGGTNPLLLFLASGICAVWLIESLLAQFGI
jgi:hypothetical protein